MSHLALEGLKLVQNASGRGFARLWGHRRSNALAEAMQSCNLEHLSATRSQQRKRLRATR